MFSVGPFDLHEPVGQGGMGVVWRGVHRAWKVPVAVKLLTGKRAQDPEYLAAFRNEVRSVAGLSHPHIVLVYDHGTVSRRAAELSLGQLRAGTPYLAMELCEAGSLSRRPPMAWTDVRDVLLCLLDALAHAHARGVVHRDLKPGNVLIGGERPGIKLTDFGMAAPTDGDADSLLLGGTPAYMSPEQIEARWRDFGPWTDLYALGCLAWAITTGEPPFPTDRALLAHLRQDPPAYRPRMNVPPGFEDWLRALLVKDIGGRVSRAADAAWTLLGMPVSMPGNTPVPAAPEDDTVRLPLQGHRVTLVWPRAAPPEQTARQLPRPPIPSDWRRPPSPPAWTHLRGAGLGLWGLRRIPMVDREAERDALWEALRAAGERARAVVLQGPSGFGKSRLAAWLVERAHEVGAATVLRVTHEPGGGPLDGLRGLLVRHFRLSGLEKREEVLNRVGEVLDRDGPDEELALAITELVSPADDASPVAAGVPPAMVRFRSLSERFGVLRRLITRLGQARPVVLWADDVAWGLQTLLLAQNLLTLEAPLLVVLTARDEDLAQRPIEAEALVTLLRRDGVSRISVGPLPPDHRRVLVRELLGLEGELAARVEARTEGNPLFAVDLVGDWVERGLLVPGEVGFRLKSGAELEIPADVRAVWTERLARAIRAEHAPALEIAACLGLEVDGDEWRQACRHAGIDAPIALVDALIAHRLATAGPDGPQSDWAFVHGMIRETVLEGAKAAGRWVGHMQACAAMLRSRTHPGAADRLGRTLLAAGDAEAALLPLLLAARRRSGIGDYGIAAELIADRERALDLLGAPQDDSDRVEDWIAGCLVQQHWGDLALAEELAAKAAATAERLDDPKLEAQPLRQLGRILRRKGDLPRAWAALERGERLATVSGELDVLAGVHSEMGWIQLRRGKIGSAREYAELSLQEYARSDARGQSSAWAQLGETARQAGDLEAAQAWFEKARERYARDGYRWGVASTLNGLGEIARMRGDLAAAEAHYRASWERYTALGETDAMFPETNLGLVLVEQGRWTEARRVLERVRQRAGAADAYRLVAALWAGLLACAAGEDDGPAFDRALSTLRGLLKQHKLVDSDLARHVQIAAAHASGPRAAAAVALADEQLRALGRA
jgi:tetratricopeptide (TPR) repeat protein